MKSSAIYAAVAAVVATSATFPAFAATRYMYDAIDDVRVAPLVKTSWGQGEHLVKGAYNYYTPNYYVCGCVATAGSQIMRYWRFPADAVAAGTFACAVDSIAREFIMKGGTYDWANMPTNYVAGTTTDTEAEAIGKLVFDVGVSLRAGMPPAAEAEPQISPPRSRTPSATPAQPSRGILAARGFPLTR